MVWRADVVAWRHDIVSECLRGSVAGCVQQCGSSWDGVFQEAIRRCSSAQALPVLLMLRVLRFLLALYGNGEQGGPQRCHELWEGEEYAFLERESVVRVTTTHNLVEGRMRGVKRSAAGWHGLLGILLW